MKLMQQCGGEQDGKAGVNVKKRPNLSFDLLASYCPSIYMLNRLCLNKDKDKDAADADDATELESGSARGRFYSILL